MEILTGTNVKIKLKVEFIMSTGKEEVKDGKNTLAH